ncbi:DUF4175 family protein [Coralloluteibacterium thermophilus]|uniref:DUF4175 family protein n=1 Tax=Coralloluteibacterium thermophilum TaxID=2707049 RepID=A0ABV9NLW7_9GAMM
MSAALARLHVLRATARRRRMAADALVALPLLLGLAVLAYRLGGAVAASGALLAGVAVGVWFVRRRAAVVDLPWVARRLDASVPALEDSTALLLHAPGGGLAALQRARIAARIETLALPDLRPAWPRIALLLAWAAGAVLAVAVLLWPRAPGGIDGEALRSGGDARDAATETRILAASIAIAPPAYTGLPTRTEPALDASAPAGATLDWRLRLDPQPTAVHLATHEGERIPLRREGGEWRGRHVLDASLLYRVEVEGAPPADASLHRLDAVPDQPPQVRVIEPDQNVVMAEPGQATWTLLFEASDDYGLGEARLHLTLAQGSGENVAFSEQARVVEGEGEPTRRRYALTLDLAELGLGAGDDLVARLDVDDTRTPERQTTRSAAVVLRWPPPQGGDATGFDGLVQRTLPAYFRSQRQIIIDTEALRAERMRMPNDEFVTRSDAIGVDQRLLRLRYGQFMGEEAEGGGEGHGHDHDDHAGHDHGPGEHHHRAAPAPPPRRPANDSLFADAAAHEDAPAEPEPEAPAPAPAFGDAGNVLAEYGHVHDHAEAATLLDPETKALLREALSAMWQSEGFLRQGNPVSALPHQYRALEFIKKVQQSDRIYLARVGLELPPIDESRRLSGDLDGVTDRPDRVPASTAGAPELAALWRALDDGAPAEADLDAASRWVLDNQERLDDPLALVAAIDAVQRDPGCAACRDRLRAALWPALPVPAAGVLPRPAPDAAGAAYLDALREDAP